MLTTRPLKPSVPSICKAVVVCILFRLIKIKEWVDKNDPGAVIIPFSGVFENSLLEMNDEERKIHLEEVKATR